MASVDNGLVPLFTVQFSTNLEMLLQQKASMLRGKVDEGFHVGRMASPINQVGAVVAKAPTGRFTPKERTDATYVRRWVTPNPGEINQLVDTFDELQTIVDPKSKLVAGAASAAARWWDDQLITAATGNATIGEDPASLTTETFDTTKFQISVSFGASSANGLTPAKLIEAKRIFRHYHNDLDTDTLCVVIGSKQESDLLSQQQFTSREYAEKPVLVDGKLSRWLGFDIVVSERLPDNSGAANQRGCLAFVKSGMYLGMWKDLTNRISIRNDLTSEPWQIYTAWMSGATRTQPGKVLQILCSDSTGSDITP